MNERDIAAYLLQNGKHLRDTFTGLYGFKDEERNNEFFKRKEIEFLHTYLTGALAITFENSASVVTPELLEAICYYTF